MGDEAKAYRCGTPSYARSALVILLFWLLWDDVCHTLMEGELQR